MDKTEKRWHFRDQQAQPIPLGSIGFFIPGLQKKASRLLPTRA